MVNKNVRLANLVNDNTRLSLKLGGAQLYVAVDAL